MKYLLLTIAMIVATAGFAVPARAVVLDRGVVVVTNTASDPITVVLEDAWNAGHIIEKHISIQPGGTWRSNGCCFVAGTSYRIRLHRGSGSGAGGNYYHSFRPHHCKRNDVSYGFYHVVFNAQNVFYDGDPSACYEGPL